jgi:hypothetical protein
MYMIRDKDTNVSNYYNPKKIMFFFILHFHLLKK